MTAHAPAAVAPVYALAAIHPVADPEATGAVLAEALGFQVRSRDDRGTILVDNGALALRLVPGAAFGGEPSERPLELEVETEDLDGALETLRRKGEILEAEDERRVARDRIERLVRLAEGVTVRLVRILTEDDLGHLPPLPANLVWEERSDLLVRRVLREVPLAFRRAARERATGRAEAVALREGRVEVDEASAVRGLVEATPEFQHERLQRALEDEGIEVPRVLEVSNEAR